jgi:diguanylate cyclase (GGDEF)-like protein
MAPPHALRSLAGARRMVASVRQWQVWTLRPVAKVYLIAVLGLDLGATAAAFATAAPRGGLGLVHLGTFAVAVGCGVVVVEATRGVKEVKGTGGHDLAGVWYLTVAITCPPALALLTPIVLGAYKLVRIRRTFPYRRVFSDAAISLGYGAASVAFHAAPAALAGPRPGQHSATWLGLAAGCGILALLVNHGLALTAMRLATPEVPLREAFGGRTGWAVWLIELCLAVLVALLVAAISPLVMIVALPVVAHGQRQLMRAQLVSQTRVDAKSGLLNAAAWEREADVEASEARREHQPLTVLLAEVDEFSSIGKMAGPDAADQVLRKIAANVTDRLPPGAQAGRVDGAKFAVVLPRVTEDRARRVGERIRDHVAAEPVDVEHDGRLDFVFRPTISVGIAGVADSRGTLAEVIAAADTALAKARAGGGNRVGVAVSGAQTAAD